MSTMGLHFEKFQWGDPALAQIASSDAQAYMDYPSSDVLTAMTSGPEQASPALIEALQNGLNGSGVGPQTDAAPTSTVTSGDGSCANCTFPSWLFRPCCYSYLNPLNGGNWTGANQNAGSGGGGVNIMGAKDWKSLVVYAVLGLLAVGIILIGVKGIAEA